MISFCDIIDYFKPIQLGEVKSDEYLRYFPGGWNGVKKRFGDSFRASLRKTSRKDLYEIGNLGNFDPLIIREILKGDYRRMDDSVVETLCNVFQYCVNEGLRNPAYSREERSLLLQKIYDEKFMGCGTVISENGLKHATNDDLNPDTVVNVYLMIHALREL